MRPWGGFSAGRPEAGVARGDIRCCTCDGIICPSPTVTCAREDCEHLFHLRCLPPTPEGEGWQCACHSDGAAAVGVSGGGSESDARSDWHRSYSSESEYDGKDPDGNDVFNLWKRWQEQEGAGWLEQEAVQPEEGSRVDGRPLIYY